MYVAEVGAYERKRKWSWERKMFPLLWTDAAKYVDVSCTALDFDNGVVEGHSCIWLIKGSRLVAAAQEEMGSLYAYKKNQTSELNTHQHQNVWVCQEE